MDFVNSLSSTDLEVESSTNKAEKDQTAKEKRVTVLVGNARFEFIKESITEDGSLVLIKELGVVEAGGLVVSHKVDV